MADHRMQYGTLELHRGTQQSGCVKKKKLCYISLTWMCQVMLQFVLICRDTAKGKVPPEPDSQPVKTTLENVTVSKHNTRARTARRFPLPEPLGRSVSAGARP